MAFIPTPEQRAILQHDRHRPARVRAGPGTGKSATLVELVTQLLGGPDPPRIRLLTFTRAATTELAQKASEHPETTVERPSTIHSFAISVLLQNAGAGGLPEPLRIADDWERDNVIVTTLARRAGIGAPDVKRLLDEMAAGWESLRPDRDPRVDQIQRARFEGVRDEHRRVFGYTLLQELPYALRGALQAHPELEGLDYDLLVVDEYQDLNACDLEVIKLIRERGCMVIGAGDDDQSIYSRRKADPEGIRRFLDDYPDAADYPLSTTQRCGSQIIEWASHVIEGDPDRPARPRLTPAPGSPPGEVALLAFAGHVAEARGVAQLAQNLIAREAIPPSEILILFRGDYRSMFSDLIKPELERLQIPYSDPDAVKRCLAESDNRRLLEIFRLAAHCEDSVAWASLLRLTPGVGQTFLDYAYGRARDGNARFGPGLLEAHAAGFPGAPAAPANRARILIDSLLAWLDGHPAPEADDIVWGRWIIEAAGGDVVPSPNDYLTELLLGLDELVEPGEPLGRYLGQIIPLGQDRERAESGGVRIMTMGAAKGLTVQATIIAALEDEVIPNPRGDLQEERRLLYVAMTRARKFVYGTWARHRQGRTARAGSGRVIGRRSPSSFISGGPVQTLDGPQYMEARWG